MFTDVCYECIITIYVGRRLAGIICFRVTCKVFRHVRHFVHTVTLPVIVNDFVFKVESTQRKFESKKHY